MEFEWDLAKEAANVAKHGITFTDATSVFDDPHVLTEDSTKPDFGEERSLAISEVAGRLAAVVYTDRKQRRRIISARKASKNERERYDQSKTTS